MNHYLFIIVCCVYLVGCSSASSIKERLETDLHNILEPEAELYSPAATTEVENSTIELSYKEFLKKTLNRSIHTDIGTLNYQLSRVDVNQANSNYLPRIFIEATSQIPLNKDDIEKEDLYSVGLFIKYNLLSAIFTPDKVSAAEAASDRARLQIIDSAMDVSGNLLQMLIEERFLLSSEKIHNKAIQTCDKVIPYINDLSSSDGDSYSLMQQWLNRCSKYKSDLLTVESRRKTLRERLNVLAGYPISASVQLLDFDKYLESVDTINAPESLSPELVKKVWSQRNDINIAQIDLFLAEMKIEKTKLERYPTLNLSLGVGQILLDSGETSSFTPSLELSYPIFDFGDIKRKITRAKIERDVTRKKLIQLIREAPAQVGEKISAIITTKADLDLATEQNNTKQSNITLGVEMSKLGLTSTLDLAGIELSAMESSLILERATRLHRNSAIDYLKSFGKWPDQFEKKTPSPLL